MRLIVSARTVQNGKKKEGAPVTRDLIINMGAAVNFDKRKTCASLSSLQIAALTSEANQKLTAPLLSSHLRGWSEGVKEPRGGRAGRSLMQSRVTMGSQTHNNADYTHMLIITR